MKNKVAALTALVLLTVSFPVAAKEYPPRPFLLQDVVFLNGAQVPAGIYELTCESHGSIVRVTLSKDGKFVATARGVWVKNGAKYTEDEVLLRVNSDGSKSLIEIRIAGVAKAIVLDRSDRPVRYTALRP